MNEHDNRVLLEAEQVIASCGCICNPTKDGKERTRNDPHEYRCPWRLAREIRTFREGQ